jgi:hypothetical protein
MLKNKPQSDSTKYTMNDGLCVLQLLNNWLRIKKSITGLVCAENLYNLFNIYKKFHDFFLYIRTLLY